MSRRNLALGSAASFALAGAVLCAVPSYAQYRYSTPAEEAQTQTLNAQQATAPTTVVVATSTEPGYDAAIAEHSAAQSQYDAQLKDYRDKVGAYEKQKQDYQQQLEGYNGEHSVYRAESSNYAADLADPPVAVVGPPVVVETPPAAVVAAPPATTVIIHDRLIDLHDVRDPDRELAGAPVEDRAGLLAGHVLHMTNQDGTEAAVIDLRDRNKKIVLRGEHLRFDPDADVVVADLSLDELNSMPARF